MRKLDHFCLCENKGAVQLCITAQLISAFVSVTRIEQLFVNLYPKFQDSSSFSMATDLCRASSETPKNGFLAMRVNSEYVQVTLKVSASVKLSAQQPFHCLATQPTLFCKSGVITYNKLSELHQCQPHLIATGNVHGAAKLWHLSPAKTKK